MLAADLNALNAAAVSSLCEDGAQESTTLEFKLQLPDTTDPARAEFAKDVTALANAEGGDIVFGIAEVKSVASMVKPIAAETADAAMRRLTQTLLARVEPPIAGLDFKRIGVAGGYVLVLRVPASLDSPHWTIINDARHFYVRRGTLITTMTHEEVRSAFDRRANQLDRAEAFRAKRLAILKSNTGPAVLIPGVLWAVHVIPLAHVPSFQGVDVHAVAKGKLGSIFNVNGATTSRYNLDGVLIIPTPHPQSGRQSGYVQVFRDGSFEVAHYALKEGQQEDFKRAFSSMSMSAGIRLAIHRVVGALRTLRLSGPFLVAASVMNLDGVDFEFPAPETLYRADRSDLILPFAWEARVPADGSAADLVARDVLDTVWQSFGIERCSYFDTEGKWNVRNS